MIMNIKNSLIGFFILAIVLAVILHFVYPAGKKETLNSNAEYLAQYGTEQINTDLDTDPNLENNIPNTHPNTNQIDLNDETTFVEEKSTAASNTINAGELSCSDIPFYTYKNILEIEESSARRGYFSDDDVTTYKSYGWPTLLDLGKQGDLLALKILSESPSLRSNSEARKTFFLNAAIYGSTDALNKLADLTLNKADKFIISGDQEQAIKLTVESLAWYQVMIIRDDDTGHKLFEFMLKRSIRSLTINNIETNQNELLPLIHEYGTQFYELLETERNKRGLEKFDNSIPEAQKKFYALTERFSEDDIWELYSEMEILAVECGFF